MADELKRAGLYELMFGANFNVQAPKLAQSANRGAPNEERSHRHGNAARVGDPVRAVPKENKLGEAAEHHCHSADLKEGQGYLLEPLSRNDVPAFRDLAEAFCVHGRRCDEWDLK
jgi:hypothetical protein